MSKVLAPEWWHEASFVTKLTNIRCHCTKFSHLGHPAPGICAPLWDYWQRRRRDNRGNAVGIVYPRICSRSALTWCYWLSYEYNGRQIHCASASGLPQHYSNSLRNPPSPLQYINGKVTCRLRIASDGPLHPYFEKLQPRYASWLTDWLK